MILPSPRKHMSHFSVLSAVALTSLVTAACGGGTQPGTAAGPSMLITGTTQVTVASDLDWQALNPARGDASPLAANVWGDRAEPGPTGFVVRFVDGFSSPPHIHNVTYRGVVLNGMIHNDDPDAAAMWMQPGSFWTQPAGEAHITAAEGAMNTAIIEIDDGPYLVHPTDDAFANGELPVNIDAANLVWTHAAGVETAYLWGTPDTGAHGRLISLDADETAYLQATSGWARAVVVDGILDAPPSPDATPGTAMAPGSAVSTNGTTVLTCDTECLIYVRADAPVRLTQ